MSDSYVQLQLNSTGSKVDCGEISVGANTVERQRIVIADDVTAAALGKVTNGNPATTDYGLVVRQPLFASSAVGQAIIAVTGTAVQLASNALGNGVVITNGGTTNVFVGGATVNNTSSGTGNGYVLVPGASVSLEVSNTNLIYINGTATTSWISFAGN